MKRYPLLFGLRDVVQGNGFLAGVGLAGRALLHEEAEGDVWVEGVNPGGFSGTGSSPVEALEDFRRSYTALLFDIASDTDSFEAFRREVEAFFDNAGETPLREWNEAVEDVRAGRLDADWLVRRPADSRLGVRVDRIDHLAAANNALEEGPALAA